MSIDYQQILMEMNRPSRRQGRSLGRKLVILFFLLVLGGGAYATWHYGILGVAWTHATALYASAVKLVGVGETAAPAASGGQGSPEAEVAAVQRPAAEEPAQNLRPPVGTASQTVRQAVPATGPIDVAAAAQAPAATGRPGPAASAAPAAVQANPAQNRQATPAVAGSAGGAAPAPVLSDVRAQLLVIDEMLQANPAEAMRRIEDLMADSSLEPEDAAEVGYRVGYAARMLRDEEKAEKSWRETAEKWPALRGGRFSALALADTWYHRYAGERPQISYWDDIQALYSQVIGQDDAPFLPEDLKRLVKDKLNRINDSILFGSGPTKLGRYHTVESGELLGTIGNRFRVDYESIARVNGINPNRIRQGMDLKIVVGEVTVVVRKNEKDPNRTPTVTWFIDGRWAREYPACVGDGDKTPAGTYQFTSKERDPSWTNPLNGQLLPNDHPDNILGSRWMAMKGMNTNGLGIHGTTVDDSIPGYTSAGCVRLLNKDVEELFSFARIGNKVVVLE